MEGYTIWSNRVFVITKNLKWSQSHLVMKRIITKSFYSACQEEWVKNVRKGYRDRHICTDIEITLIRFAFLRACTFILSYLSDWNPLLIIWWMINFLKERLRSDSVFWEQSARNYWKHDILGGLLICMQRNVNILIGVHNIAHSSYSAA